MSWDAPWGGAPVPGERLASQGLAGMSEGGRAGAGDCWGSLGSGAAFCGAGERKSTEDGWVGTRPEGRVVRGLLPRS